MRREIKTSTRDFENKKKAYPLAKDALNEIVTNSFFAPNVKNIFLNFHKSDKQHIWFINDGESMTHDQIINAISIYGCESAETAGNENGMGLKCSASYFTQFNEDSMLVLASKENNELLGIGWIDSFGRYCEWEDFSEEQRIFVEEVLSTFTDGTITMLFNTNVEMSEIDDFITGLKFMFTHGLNTINFTVNINGRTFTLQPFDRHYSHLNYITKRNTREITFKRAAKLYKCTLITTDTRDIQPSDFTFIDEIEGDVIKDFGIHMGYDNGYMPIHTSQVEIIGYKTKPQYYYMRGSLIAHPVENDKKVAGVKEWKEFFSLIGKMSQQKVPNLNKPFDFHKSNGELKEVWRSFYESVVTCFKDDINEWLPATTRDTEDKFSTNKLNELNIEMERHDFTYCDITWKFRFSHDVENIAKYDNTNNTIYLKFSEESNLLKKLIKGGRSGRNGSNDLHQIIIPTIDIFKMDMEDESTTDGVKKIIKKRIRKFNNYYTR